MNTMLTRLVACQAALHDFLSKPSRAAGPSTPLLCLRTSQVPPKPHDPLSVHCSWTAHYGAVYTAIHSICCAEATTMHYSGHNVGCITMLCRQFMQDCMHACMCLEQLHVASIAYLLLQLASSEMEQQVRSTLGTSPDQEVTWAWKPSGYSPWVRLLAEVKGIDIGLLGKGVNGQVH